MNTEPLTPLIDAMDKPKPFRPDNTPRQGKMMPRYKKSGRGTPGAFKKCKGPPKLQTIKDQVTRLANRLQEELWDTGNATPKTRAELDSICGEGTTKEMIEELTKEAA